MSLAKRFAIFVGLCLAISLISEVILIQTLFAFPIVQYKLSGAGDALYFAIPMALCAAAGIWLNVWTRQSLWTNFFASLVCFAAPFLTLVFAISLSCVWIPECPK